MEGLWCGDGVGGTLPFYPRAHIIAIRLQPTDHQFMLQVDASGNDAQSCSSCLLEHKVHAVDNMMKQVSESNRNDWMLSEKVLDRLSCAQSRNGGNPLFEACGISLEYVLPMMRQLGASSYLQLLRRLPTCAVALTSLER